MRRATTSPERMVRRRRRRELGNGKRRLRGLRKRRKMRLQGHWVCLLRIGMLVGRMLLLLGRLIGWLRRLVLVRRKWRRVEWVEGKDLGTLLGRLREGRLWIELWMRRREVVWSERVGRRR